MSNRDEDMILEFMTQELLGLCRKYTDKGYSKEEMWNILRQVFEEKKIKNGRFKTFEEVKSFIEDILTKEDLK